MNKNQKKLIEILSLSIRGQKLNELNVEEIEWDIVLKEAIEHDIQMLLYTALKDIPSSSDSWKEFIARLKMITMRTVARYIQHNQDISIVLTRLKEAGIPVIALKGIVLKELYPCPELRTMGDTDLLVPIEYINLSKNIIEDLGYYEDMPHARGVHLAHETKLYIELHWELLEQNKLKHSIESLEKDVWSNKVLTNICGIQMHRLGNVDQMLYLCFHMITHLIYGGFGLRQLCDFILCTESTKDIINWEEFWDKAGKLGIANFASAIFMVCSQTLGLDAPLPPTKFRHKQKIIQKLTLEIMRSGTFGMKAMKWTRSINIFYGKFKDVNIVIKCINLIKFSPILLNELPYYTFTKLILDNRRKRLLRKLDLI